MLAEETPIEKQNKDFTVHTTAISSYPMSRVFSANQSGITHTGKGQDWPYCIAKILLECTVA